MFGINGKRKIKQGGVAGNSTTARDDKQLTRNAVKDCTASSRVLAQHYSTDTGVLLPSSIVRRRVLQHELRGRAPHDFPLAELQTPATSIGSATQRVVCPVATGCFFR